MARNPRLTDAEYKRIWRTNNPDKHFAQRLRDAAHLLQRAGYIVLDNAGVPFEKAVRK